MKNKEHIDFLKKESHFSFSSREWTHLQGCADCQREEKELKELFASLDKVPLPKKSDRFWEEQASVIGQRIDQERSYGRKGWGFWGWIPSAHHPFSAAFASLLILIVFSGGFYLSKMQTPGGESREVAFSFPVDEESLPWDRVEDSTVTLSFQDIVQLGQRALAESLASKDSPGLDYALDENSQSLSDFQSLTYN